ncbi:hypothetical protein AVEN_155957-1 [Araneus ventricosus]|uniref:Uncharacterized protein n=1 Tax=Araneus ventricosus TaxID=182803 RepID=A0A4Y2GUX2_ARAVE|nr:hypothetical protein AVEN_155957-1 [Araneus ventricosus]
MGKIIKDLKTALSDDEDDALAGTPSPSFCDTPARGHLTDTQDLMCNRPTRRYKPVYTVDLQWNRVWNFLPSGPEAKTLPLGHRCPDLRLDDEKNT